MTRAERISEIRKRAEAATPGPWESGLVGIFSDKRYVVGHPEVLDGHDRLFIAAARDDIPWLLSEIQRLESELVAQARAHAGLEPEPGTPEHRAEVERLWAQLDERPEWLKPRTTYNPMAALMRKSRGKP